MPRGKAITIEEIVTISEPVMRGRIPYNSSIGYQRLDKRSPNEISCKVGNPSFNKKTKISNTKSMVDEPAIRIVLVINFSDFLMMCLFADDGNKTQVIGYFLRVRRENPFQVSLFISCGFSASVHI